MGDTCIYDVGPYRGYHEYVQGLGFANIRGPCLGVPKNTDYRLVYWALPFMETSR